MEKHRSCGIEGGFVSALESIFYQDPYEAEVLLAEAVKGTAYRHAMILNPTLPGWKDDLARAVRELDIKAVRLVPGFHGYKLTDAVMDEVTSLLVQYDLSADQMRFGYIDASALKRGEEVQTLRWYDLPEQTVNTAEICKRADIIVTAAGVLNSLTKDFVREGQIVIDVSMNWNPEKITSKGKGGMSGDAIFDEVEPIVEAITPVPGGVGAVTTSVLIGHVVEAAARTLA